VMSDHKSDDGAQRRPMDPGDAAARLAALLASPLEPVVRPNDKPQDAPRVHREVPPAPPAPSKPPADTAAIYPDSADPPHAAAPAAAAEEPIEETPAAVA